jgi:hypothetical protein
MKTGWPQEVSRIRYTECIGNGEDASAWLEAFPKSPKLAFRNDDFRIMCFMRLGLSFPEIIHAAHKKGGRFQYKCPLCSKNRLDKGDVDIYGRHLCHGCRFSSTQRITHDAVRDALADMHTSNGNSVSKEVTMTPIDVFGMPLPDNTVESSSSTDQNSSSTTPPASNSIGSSQRSGVLSVAKERSLRADLVVTGPGMTLLEVTVTDPISNKDEDKEAVDSAALPQVERRAKEKIKKYKEANVIVEGFSGRALVVFCFSTFGRLNEAGFRYIKNLSTENDRKGNDAVRFRQYWFQRISCALQRNLAMQFRNNLLIFRGDIVLSKHNSSIVTRADYLENGHIRNGDFGSCSRN